MYMPGRRRTGSKPSRTVMSFAVYAIRTGAWSRVVGSGFGELYQTGTKRTSGTSLAPPFLAHLNTTGRNIMNFTLKTGLAVALLSAATAGHLYAQNNRFQGMDRNHDGVITRDKWR